MSKAEKKNLEPGSCPACGSVARPTATALTARTPPTVCRPYAQVTTRDFQGAAAHCDGLRVARHLDTIARGGRWVGATRGKPRSMVPHESGAHGPRLRQTPRAQRRDRSTSEGGNHRSVLFWPWALLMRVSARASSAHRLLNVRGFPIRPEARTSRPVRVATARIVCRGLPAGPSGVQMPARYRGSAMADRPRRP